MTFTPSSHLEKFIITLDTNDCNESKKTVVFRRKHLKRRVEGARRDYDKVR